MHLKLASPDFTSGALCILSAFPLADRERQRLTKTLRIMKITAIILLTACLAASANGLSQKVTLSLKEAPVQQVFKEVSRQTGVSIVYREALFEGLAPVTITVKDATIKEVLDKCLKGQPFAYLLEGPVIVIRKNNELTAEDPVVNKLPIEIKGKITDETGKPLPDASVKLKGTDQGTSTDANGNFVLQVPDGSHVLTISYIGYQTIEMTASQNSTLKIILKQVDARIEEVVVVGYSNKKRSELTSAVTVISEEKLRDVTANNIGTMLQGKVAGLQVINNSGVPGAAPEIRLRGVSSINATQSPLFVIDGIIGGNYDPNDVESVTVLKDAGATAMYGSQANGGVIIITTKKAKNGKNHFETRITTGFRKPDFGEMDMMNSSELYEYSNT